VTRQPFNAHHAIARIPQTSQTGSMPLAAARERSRVLLGAECRGEFVVQRLVVVCHAKRVGA
jgi:hypothetical protein